MPDQTRENFTAAGRARFATTHWSMVRAAADSSTPDHQKALSTLCQTYWFPLYAYLRRCGDSPDEAADHTQAFFAQMLEKQFLKQIKPNSGKFRSFLLTAVKHFVANEADRARAKKRGGGKTILSLDFEDAEGRYAIEPAGGLSPEQLFAKSWALQVLERALDRLRDELASKNRQNLFEHLKMYIAAESSTIPIREAAEALGMTEGAVRVAIHRLRRRCRELLRDEIAQTVAGPDDIDDEIRGLFTALGH
jgi:RNA polymerase sigma-70 factor (ECF subfamily)